MNVFDCTYSAFVDSLRAFEIVGTGDAAPYLFFCLARKGFMPVASAFVRHCVREPKRLKKRGSGGDSYRAKSREC